MTDSLKKVAVLQSNYIPWKGYFDIINSADLFIFYDDVQFTKNDWRNRNIIKTPKGTRWVSIPCGGNIKRLICDVLLEDSSWQKSHWDMIKQNYSQAPFYKYYEPFLKDIYLTREWGSLSELNQKIIREVCQLLNIKTSFDDSRNYNLSGTGESRLFELLNKVRAAVYISGPAAKNYTSDISFNNAGIGITWVDYDGYPEYRQLFQPFVHEVSIVDLLLNEGPDSHKYMKSFKRV